MTVKINIDAMQDLLNEEEFVAKKAYNPWKTFRLFYAIAAAEVFVFYGIRTALSNLFSINYSLLLSLSFNLLPLVTALFMFYYRKENFLIKTKTILLGLLGLVSVYALIVSLGTLWLFEKYSYLFSLSEKILMQLTSFASTILFHMFVCSIVILIIAARHKRKSKLKTA